MSEGESRYSNYEADKRPVEPGLPLLVKNFDVVRAGEVTKPSLESFPALLDSVKYRQHCFEETKKAWLDQYNPEELLAHVSSKPNKEHYKYQKRVRKYGSMLLNMYRFFDVSHTSPDKLHQLVVDLGNLNDRYQTRRQEKLSDVVTDEIYSVEQSYEIEYAGDQDFQDYCQKQLQELEQYCQSETLALEDFHIFRKKIRMFANLIQTAAVEDLAGGPHWLFLKLDGLSGRLGEIIDDLRGKQLMSEVDARLEVPLADSDVADFEESLPYLKKAIGLE
ncbi:MAG: hypothetical protein PHW95_03290 [Patescibacteria group bacterium]|nr:hypothetical protein [Patescibacteria group bacterium]